LDRTEIPQAVPCASLAELNPIGSSEQNQSSNAKVSGWAAWGVQLFGDFTQDRVLARYENLRRKYSAILTQKDPIVIITNGPSGRTKRYLARAAGNSREEAEQLCKRLQSAGVACFAVKNPE
jgi:hypothetical protein